MTIMCDIKFDLIMCEFYCVKVFVIFLLSYLTFWSYLTLWNVFHLIVDVFSEFSKYIH